MPLKITNERAEAFAASPCPFINANDPWCGESGQRQRLHQPNQGADTARIPEHVGKRCARAPSHRNTDLLQGANTLEAAPGRTRDQIGKLFRENATRTRGIPAKKASNDGP